MPLQTGDMGRDALPAPVAKLPIVGVTPAALCAVRLLVAGARVNDCKVAKDTDQHVVLANVLDRRTATDLGQKGLAVDQGAIGIGVEEVGREVGLKPGDIGFIDGSDVVAVEFPQGSTVLFVVGHKRNSCGWNDIARWLADAFLQPSSEKRRIVCSAQLPGLTRWIAVQMRAGVAGI